LCNAYKASVRQTFMQLCKQSFASEDANSARMGIKMIIGNRVFDTQNHTYIMGILNATPDSFSDGGAFSTIDKALYRVQQMVEEGAHILDIGGESTRPGHRQIEVDEEIERVVPIIEQVVKEFDIPISIDTYKGQVAKAALVAGACMVNDIRGLAYDPGMINVIRKANASVCLMHNRHDIPEQESEKKQFLDNVIEALQESIQKAEQGGIGSDKIMIDPGVGFGKTYEQNLIVIGSLSRFTELPYPVLLGTSRKSVIGQTLDLSIGEREEGTLVTTVMAVMAGCSFVRVHDVKKNRRAIDMTKAILRR